MKIEKIFLKFEELLALNDNDKKKDEKSKKVEKNILEKIKSCKQKVKNSNDKNIIQKEEKKIKVLKKLLKKLK